jgi:hypothetical protein
MAELAETVEQLTTEHLAIVIQTVAQQTQLAADAGVWTYGLASEVLRFFLGNKWTNENVFSIHKEVSSQNRRGRHFLKTESTDEDEQYRHMQQVTTLAEDLFNLQGVDGFRRRIALLHNEDLESALGEMECAVLLSAPEYRLRFVTPIRRKGDDYDGEVITSDNRLVCCEMKSKSEQSLPDSQAFWRTLDHARKQLPKGKPGIILVKIPETWLKQRELKAVVEVAVAKVLRQSERLVATVLTWEEWYTTAEGWKMMVTKLKDYPNKKNRLYSDDIEALLANLGRPRNSQWVQFRRLVEQVHL